MDMPSWSSIFSATPMEIVELTMVHHDAVNQFSRGARLGLVFDERSRGNTERFLNRNLGLNFVALDWNRVVGYVIGAGTNELAYLNNFGVEKSYRSSQIASKLLERFSSGLKARGVTHLKVHTKNGGNHREQYKLSDLGTLTMFDHLTTLHIAPVEGLANNSTNLQSLADLPQLSKLILERCQPEDHAPLAALTQLTHLVIEGSRCKDFEFLSNLTQLTHLKLCYTLLTDADLQLISKLPKLTCLDIGGCEDITDISPLVQLENLTELYFRNNRNIRDFSPIGRMSNLRLLNFREMSENLSDIRFLRSLPHLTDLSIIDRNLMAYFGGAPACDLSPISTLTNLTRLDLSYNNIRDISFLLPLSKLIYLNLKGNKIRDMSPISVLRQQSLRECITQNDYADQDWSLHGQDPGLQNS